MGRKRSNSNAHYPKYVHPKNGALWYVRDKKWTRLGDLGMEECDLHVAIAKVTGAKVGEAPAKVSGGKITVAALIERAFPIVTAEIAPRTLVNYTFAARDLKAWGGTGLAVDLRAKHVNALRESLLKRGGKFNAMLSVLRGVMKWAVRLGIDGLETNPCTDIERIPDRKRRRYLEAHEFAAIYQKANARLRVVMDLCFSTGQRIRDVLGITEADIGEDGILFFPSKTKRLGKQVTIKWNREMRDAVARARELRDGRKSRVRFRSAAQYAADVSREPMTSGYLFKGRGGRKAVSYNVVWDDWTAACKLAGISNARIHDLRRKSASDLSRQHGEHGHRKAKAMLLHSTDAQTNAYLVDVRPELVEGPRGSGRGEK